MRKMKGTTHENSCITAISSSSITPEVSKQGECKYGIVDDMKMLSWKLGVGGN